MSVTAEQLSQALKSGRSKVELIHEMKLRGMTIIEAIKTSRELFGVSLGEAKLLVSSHPDWREIAAAAEPMHDEIIDAFSAASPDREVPSERTGNGNAQP